MGVESEGKSETGDTGELGGGWIAGAVLIVVGLGLFALQFAKGYGQSLILILIGGLFLAGYLYRRSYGLLVPAGILLGLGIGSAGGRAFAFIRGFNSIGLGLGFLSIYLIGRAGQRSTPWWPLVPGGILLAIGLASSSETMARYLSVGWPLVLVLIGVIVLLGATEFGRGIWKPPGDRPGGFGSTDQEERESVGTRSEKD
jgi:hypothetical protein